MEEQVPSSQAPQQLQQPQGISPEQLEAMKTYAREQAIRMSFQQPPLGTQPVRPIVPQPPIENLPYQPRPSYSLEPKIVYVRRNLTVAEILVICVVSCAVVGGIQGAWNFASKYIPQIEVRVK